MSPLFTLLPLAVAAILPLVTCYSKGAPPDGCWTDRPLHGDYLPMPTWPPFSLGIEKMDKSIPANVYRPREVMKVTIRSSDPAARIKGYLIKVSGSNGASKGKWATRPGSQRYIPYCGVTHTKAGNDSSVSILWRAPADNAMRTIQFRAIVVQDIETFYNNILSARLKPDYPVPDAFKKMWEKWNSLLDFNVTRSVDELASSVQQASSLVAGALQTVPETADVIPGLSLQLGALDKVQEVLNGSIPVPA